MRSERAVRVSVSSRKIVASGIPTSREDRVAELKKQVAPLTAGSEPGPKLGVRAADRRIDCRAAFRIEPDQLACATNAEVELRESTDREVSMNVVGSRQRERERGVFDEALAAWCAHAWLGLLLKVREAK
ncbi:MAG: hypothetical protein M4D80_41045 [Myxococcota bacterium]|nr:hypothetical protein [Myxococcota bacterium]